MRVNVPRVKALSDLVDQEQHSLLMALKQDQEWVEIANDAWQMLFTPNYLDLVNGDAKLSVAYKAQADSAFGQAILSVLRCHYGQATTQLRYAVENLNIVLAILIDLDPMLTLFTASGVETPKVDSNMKSKANHIISDYDESFSDKAKQNKDYLSKWGAHQTAGLLKSTFSGNGQIATVQLLDTHKPEMVVGLLGILSETILMYHEMFVKTAPIQGFVSIKSGVDVSALHLRKRLDVQRSVARDMFKRL